MSFAGRQVLVTGGAGFIGSALVRRLVDTGAKVWVIDNLATGFERNIPVQSKFVRGDIADAELVRQVFGKAKFDTVLYLATQLAAPTKR